MALQKLVVGNWKMNGRRSDIAEIKAIAEVAAESSSVSVAICVPYTLMEAAHNAAPNLAIGAQDCHHAETGAHTGCVSAAMLAECGVQYVIVGHSERRVDQAEASGDVKQKASAVMRNDMHAIICVGESEEERDSGNAVDIVIKQLLESLPDVSDEIDYNKVSIAYEPIWAIGTGRIPSLEDVEEMHIAIRSALVERYKESGNDIHILYGGSMNGSNAADLMRIDNVDGGLVGGASLKAAKFAPVISAGAQ